MIAQPKKDIGKEVASTTLKFSELSDGFLLNHLLALIFLNDYDNDAFRGLYFPLKPPPARALATEDSQFNAPSFSPNVIASNASPTNQISINLH